MPAALRLLPPGTFRAARGLPAVVLLRGIAAGTFIAAESFIPLMLVTQRGLSPTMAGLSLAGGGLTWALGSYVQARPRLRAAPRAAGRRSAWCCPPPRSRRCRWRWCTPCRCGSWPSPGAWAASAWGWSSPR